VAVASHQDGGFLSALQHALGNLLNDRLERRTAFDRDIDIRDFEFLPFHHSFARSLQRGRASAPMIPQPVHTIRGPKAGTATSSGQRSALSNAWWWQFQHDTSSDRTPSSRMLPSVIGSIGWSKRATSVAEQRVEHRAAVGRQHEPAGTVAVD
jgi:hypothetical protein